MVTPVSVGEHREQASIPRHPEGFLRNQDLRHDVEEAADVGPRLRPLVLELVVIPVGEARLDLELGEVPTGGDRHEIGLPAVHPYLATDPVPLPVGPVDEG